MTKSVRLVANMIATYVDDCSVCASDDGRRRLPLVRWRVLRLAATRRAAKGGRAVLSRRERSKKRLAKASTPVRLELTQAEPI